MIHLIGDALIRRKARFGAIDPARHSVRIARTVEDYETAFKLLRAAYVYAGIESASVTGDLRITDHHALPEATVLLAYADDRPVGTMTVTADSPAGLPLDKDYPEELEALRANGHRLAELGSFAVIQPAQRMGIGPFISLGAYRTAFGPFDADAIVIGVHPRVAPFYRAVWGFRPLARPKDHAQLDAPVVGMVVRREANLRNVRRHFKRPMRTGFLPVEHMSEGPPVPGLELPKATREHLARWKMPREVFRALFVLKSNRVANLDQRAQEELRQVRSDDTLTRFQVASAS